MRADILARIQHELGGKTKGKYVQGIRCPQCGKTEGFVATESPWMIKCGREAKCGAQHHVKDQFPDLFESWTERYGQQSNAAESPNAVADAYMAHGRGFDLSRIRGWYQQEQFYDSALGIGSTTVRFELPGGYWERLIDKPQRFGKKKARFKPGLSYAGTWWLPPAVELQEVDYLWLVEGIFDAIAHFHHDNAAAALFSCNNYPAKALAELDEACKKAGRNRPTLVWALDGDPAGRAYLRRWVERARKDGWDCKAAIAPARGAVKVDWNELHLRGEWTDHLIDHAHYLGELEIASRATEKALLMYNHNHRKEFPFEFRQRTYWFKMDLDKYQREMDRIFDEKPAISEAEARDQALFQCGGVQEIANCHPVPLYYQANRVTDESWYYYRIEFPHDGPPVKATFTGGQLASSGEFKKRLLGVAPGAIWEGQGYQLDRLLRDQIGRIKTVDTIDFIGYSKRHKTWVFGDQAVHAGGTYTLNSEDFFEIGRLSLKTLSESVHLSINPDLEAHKTDWARALLHCFGDKGVIALAYWLGTLFAEQVREHHKSFPFLEIVGEAGAGKSTLIEFLWKLCGRSDYEGFDPSKASMPARARNFAQVSNLPVVLIESDRDQEGHKGKQFDWDELKTAYNGRSVRSRGIKNSGNETYEPPFRGAIVISQNAAVQSSDAIMQRIVHLTFTKAGQTAATKQLAEQLERTPIDDVSGFALLAARSEQQVLDLVFNRVPEYELQFMKLEEVRSHRVAKNHAQIMAFLDALGPQALSVFTDEELASARSELVNMAIDRQQAINADHPVVQEFWDAFDYLEGVTRGNGGLNHYGIDSDHIAVNLRHFEALCNEYKLRLPPPSELKRHLRTSRSRKFLEANKSLRSAVFADNRVLKCWIFKRS
nr:hypothetical protein 2 [Saccharospirillaceae bacterium]